MSAVLLWGKLYSQFNIKWLFVIAMVLLNGGTALSGAAPNTNTLIGGRVLSGLGATGTYLGAMNVIAAVTDMKQRPVYIDYISRAYTLSTIIAPFTGGAFADSSATWRWGFYIVVCFSALFAPGYVFLFPSRKFLSQKLTLAQHFQRIDVVGNILWAGAVATGFTAVSFGGAMYQWDSGQIIGLLVASGILWLLLIVQQKRNIGTSEDHRVFPSRFLHSLEMWILFWQTFFSTTGAFVPLFLIPLYFQFTRGTSAVSTGLYFLPPVSLRGAMSLVSGVCIRKYGYFMPWFFVGSVIFLAGSTPFLKFDSSTSPSVIVGCTVLIGFGTGMYNQAGYAVAQARHPPQFTPQVISFMMTGQSLGFALPLAIANCVFINKTVSLIKTFMPSVTVSMLQEAVTQSAGSTSVLTQGLDNEQRSRGASTC